MIFYLSFTAVWTVIVIFRTSVERRIKYSVIQPIIWGLEESGTPLLIQRGISGLIQLSIIPLGFLWMGLLMLQSLRSTLKA